MAAQQQKIVNGPGKWDLMLALFHGCSSDPNLVLVTLESGELLQLRINEVSREDGSGESWNLEGFTARGMGTEDHFSAYFNTRDRRGVLRLNP
jgi:hypothetical protein